MLTISFTHSAAAKEAVAPTILQNTSLKIPVIGFGFSDTPPKLVFT